MLAWEIANQSVKRKVHFENTLIVLLYVIIFVLYFSNINYL